MTNSKTPTRDSYREFKNVFTELFKSTDFPNTTDPNVLFKIEDTVEEMTGNRPDDMELIIVHDILVAENFTATEAAELLASFFITR